MIAYLNSLDGQMAVLDNYSMNDLEFYVAWKAASDEQAFCSNPSSKTTG